METKTIEMINASEMTKERVSPNIYYINYTYNAIEYYTPMDSTYKFDDDFEFPEEIDYGKLGYRRMVHGEDILDEFYLEEESEKQQLLEEERRVQRLKEERLQREGLLPITKEKIVVKKTSLLRYLKNLDAEYKMFFGMDEFRRVYKLFTILFTQVLLAIFH